MNKLTVIALSTFWIFTLGVATPNPVSFTQSQESPSEKLNREQAQRWQTSTKEVLARYDRSLKLWQDGQRQQAVAMMLEVHRDMNALSGVEDGVAFHELSGVTLAEMYADTGEFTEAYFLLRKAVERSSASSNLINRSDVLLTYSEVCQKMNFTVESNSAFNRIAKGEKLATYLIAADEAYRRTRLDVAERWFKEASALSPNDKRVLAGLQKISSARARGVRSSAG